MAIRLINVHTLTLSLFKSSRIPPYVIASHRWGDDETTYKDVKKNRKTDSEGYQKVVIFCNAVRKLHPAINWLWIDTCCIDQSSSAEVSEAINSMFRWYRRASFCLAYLQDVSYLELCPESDSQSRHLAQSSWFTRGWTLQELLAPRTVLFLSKEQRIIGRKGRMPRGLCTALLEDIGPAISRITRIPEAVLANYKNGAGVSVRDKLAWMTDRRTTRIEDMAYCMLGIFDISMPIVYGEGCRALSRLRDVIDGMSAASTLTWQARLSKEEDPWKDYENILQSLDDGVSNSTSIAPLLITPQSVDSQNLKVHFWGREQELSDMEDILDAMDSQFDMCACVLYGPGGMGKTQTVLEYIHRYRHRYDAVFWVHADADNHILVDFSNIGIALGLSHDPSDSLGLSRNVSRVLQHLQATDQRWLIIFDDAKYPVETLSRYRPSLAQTNSRIIVTTRAFPEVTDSSLELPPFDLDTSAEFLLSMTKDAACCSNTLDSARLLSSLLLGFPLALAQVSSLINKNKMSMDYLYGICYLNLVDRSRTRLSLPFNELVEIYIVVE